MRVTLNISAEDGDMPEQDLLSLEITSDTTIISLKEIVEAEMQIPKTSQHLYHNGHLLSDDTKTLDHLYIGDGEMLALHIRHLIGSTGLPEGQSMQQAVRRPTADQRTGTEQDPEVIRLRLLGNPQTREQAFRRWPELAAATENPVRFADIYRRMVEQEREEQRIRVRQIVELNADPFDVDAQMRIAEIIREEAVQENLQNAMEHNPEVFGRVHMLYIDVEVNGHKVKAFVDSGAQATIMSPSCAEACGIMRLIDKRFAGIARGVGTATILGRVHSAQIKIASLFLACSFTVMEGKDVDLLLGLDMLKRHQACIDLSKDKLVIQGVEVPFLGEADIPKNMEVARLDEPTVAGPGGTIIGARSGAISRPPPSSNHSIPEASSNPAPTSPVGRMPASVTFSPGDIDQLVNLGFSRDRAINALRACDGNVELAAGFLFQG